MKEKTIFLTFDDGPIPDITPAVLDILKKYRIKATFFCVGDNIVKHPTIFKQVLDQGHRIGNHTFNHLKGWMTDNESYYANIDKFDSIYQTELFRPPYGKIKPSQIIRLRDKYCIVLWSVLTCDFSQTISPEECFRIAIDGSKPGSIIVFHDSVKASANMLVVLPRYIEEMQLRGYEFALLDKQVIKQNRPINRPMQRLKGIYKRKYNPSQVPTE